MPFATDRDLLILDPNLFHDISWNAQTPVTSTNAALTSGLLTAPGINFEDAQVDEGAIAIIDGRALEVALRPSPTTLLLSLLRADASAAIITPPDVTGAKLRIATFIHQIEIAHQRLLRELRLEDADIPNILNPKDLALVEAAMTLRDIYAAANATPGADARMALNDRRLARLRAWLRVEIDINNDSEPDEERTIEPARFTRG